MKPYTHFTKTLGFSSKFQRSIFTKSQNDSTLPSDIVNVTDEFISIFTIRPFSPNNPELINLAPKLTNKVVETVLNNFKSWRVAHAFFIWASNQSGYKHNIYTYNAMASILSRARQNAPLKVLAQDVVNSRCFMSPGALGFLIRCLGSLGLVEEANMLFDQVKMMGLCVPNSYSYNCLLEAISKSGSTDFVEMRLKEMHDHGWGYDKYTLTPVLQVYCNSGEFEKALSIFNEMYNQGWVDEHVFYILVMSFTKWGEVEKACELIERMEDCNVRLNEKTFCMLIHGFVKESRIDKALQLFDKMKKSGFAPDISIYDVMIGGLCKTREREKALQLYLEMKESGKKPDVGILSKLLSSCCDEGELTHLLKESWDEMDAQTVTVLCNSVMSVLVNNGSVDKAYNLLQAMIRGEPIPNVGVEMLFNFKGKVFPNTSSFSIVIDNLLQDGKLDLALSLFRDMIQIGCKQNVLFYNNLIYSLCNSNRLEESYELLKEMEQSGFEPTHFTHNSIFGCLCMRQDVLGALNLVRKMRAHGHEPWTKHSTLLIKSLCKNGKVVDACKFLSDMVQEGFLPDTISYSAAMNGLVNNQEVDLALELFHSICASGCCPDVVAYNIMIKGLCKAQRIAESEQLLNEMIMKGLIPSCGRPKAALVHFRTMKQEGMKPDIFVYVALLSAFLSDLNPLLAFEILKEMVDEGNFPDPVDKNYVVVRDVISKLSEDTQTALHETLSVWIDVPGFKKHIFSVWIDVPGLKKHILLVSE
ncbi:hypothetical protein Pint_23211 [Pistacia integerrima]|uniref:Uncharacterized protein n=1 Tax=Pistacia integerrima TaxID=434235 RepID=A0ACC0YKZ1_9ROSI|nr:hypothetical protein Pint_23211 [Pistacia integerrima]